MNLAPRGLRASGFGSPRASGSFHTLLQPLSSSTGPHRPCPSLQQHWPRPTMPRPIHVAHAQQQQQQGAAVFDLPLAVALAGVAFEAYLQPLGGSGFEDTALSGATTTFTDPAFLSEVYQGVLFIELHSATKLRAADITGASDPYAVLSVGASTGRSGVVFQNLNPRWDHKMCIYVGDVAKDLLKVRIFDKDLLKSDDDLGFAMVPLAALQGAGPQELDVALQGPGAGEGRVQLRASYLSFSEFPQDVRDRMTASKLVVPEQGAADLRDISKQVPAIVQGVVLDADRRRRRDKQGGLQAAVGSGLDEIRGQVMKAVDDLSKLAAAGGAGAEAEVVNPWKVLASMAGHDSGAYRPLAFVESLETDSQAWLFANRDKREAVIAFRGTEQVKWKDLATDLNLTPTDLNVERLDTNAGTPLAMRLLKAVMPTEELMVHSGFLGGYDAVRQPLVRLLDVLTGTGDKGQWRVLVTGHSLGGALATLCAYELAARQGPAKRAQRVAMYSYGAPRAGNKVFAERYDRLVPDSWRITNSKDIVPSVPRLMGYAHVRHSVRLASDGSLVIQADSSDVFGEGRSGVDVIQELVDQVNTKERNWEEVYDQIAGREMELFNALKDGSALEEHMETFYLETLKACIIAKIGKEQAKPK